MKLIRQYIIPRLIIDILFFYIVLMLIGVLASRVVFDINILFALATNYLFLMFAFIINDIEDREEDSHTLYVPQSWQDNIRLSLGLPLKGVYPKNSKRFMNPFGHDLISVNVGYLYCANIALLGLIFSYLAGGIPTLVCAITILLVGFLYSSRLVRLKSQPVLDVLSHAYLLAGSQVLFFLTLPGAEIDWVSWLLVAILFMGSIAGDLRNEVRDLEADRVAGIRNTSTIIGEHRAMLASKVLHWFSVFAGVLVAGYIIVVAGDILF